MTLSACLRINRISWSIPGSSIYRCASTLHLYQSRGFDGIDAKWRQRWQRASELRAAAAAAAAAQFKTDGEQKKSAYILSMFPYPSGSLHMGHLRVYTISDVLTRFKRMQGYDVLHPMGWDAFGLPAENAAIERGIDPAEWTKSNIGKMKEQLVGMGVDFEWGRELTTCDPDFYRHTQMIFNMLHEKGLAYRANALVNWDPVDKTVLANEQVDAKGCSWRSGAKVEKIHRKQWFLRITAYQEQLLSDLKSLEGQWPEGVLSMQRNWLGKSDGAKINFAVEQAVDGKTHNSMVSVFTTRVDTLYGAQYLALSASHPLVPDLAKRYPELQAFLGNISSLPQDSKAGFLVSGVFATNPLSCVTDHCPQHAKEPLPVYVAPYVLAHGEGAVMGVPAHDTRDHAFWRENRGDEPVRPVVVPSKPDVSRANLKILDIDQPFVQEGILTSLCGDYSGLSSLEASSAIVSELRTCQRHGKTAAEHATHFRLRDWLISRQRYWGTPIPVIHCKECGPVLVPKDQLPVELPKLEGTWFKEKTGNPLEAAEDWVNTTCPNCHSEARRDTDTMDTFMDSSWYYMRFAEPPSSLNERLPFTPQAADAMLPVDIYVGGIEHAILHLLYARFMYKFLSSSDLWPSHKTKNSIAEPFRKLISQGMVHGKTFSDPHTGCFLKPEEVDLSDASKPKILKTGEIPNITWEKMSKSKYNGVNPNDCIRKYGADATRAHMLFQAPVSEVLEWEEDRIVGIQRWFGRIWRLVDSVRGQTAQNVDSVTDIILPKPTNLTDNEIELLIEVRQTVEYVTTAFDDTIALNTVVSDLMELSNTMLHIATNQQKKVRSELFYQATSALLRMLAPIAPAFTEECWEVLHPQPQSQPQATIRSIFDQPFPKADDYITKKLESKTQQCVIQENGKLRFVIDILTPPTQVVCDKDELQAWLLARIESSEEGRRWLMKRDGRGWKRVVVVRGGRVVNFVG